MRTLHGSGEHILQHPFQPVVDAQCRVLVLGSFPSVKSRENAFYYGHPQNRFWKTLAGVYQTRIPETVEEKTAFLLTRHIALWDVASTCTITGSADSSLTAYAANDIAACVQGSDINTVFANGQKAGALYRTYAQSAVGMPIAVLPSTSPANAAWLLPRLITAWQPVRAAAEPTANHIHHL